ncbi:MAG: FolD bifunctional protein nonfunctional [Candidatus Saccharibacteria bacterium]|nr:FolD bifunctional protein nonfunctional [Candidatus Saccharibacteria bacterium]
MKLLNGKELADFVKERQAKQVRNLRQEWKVLPKLAIIQTIDNPVIDTYVRLKQAYGDDILVDVDIHKVDQTELFSTIETLNHDESVHGVIIQLPLADASATERAVNAVALSKDVDGLATGSPFTPATPMAIDWLMAGYNVNLVGKKIAIVGNGRLVGAPLSALWRAQGRDVTVFDSVSSEELSSKLREFDVIVTAVGKPRLIDSDSVKIGAVIVDAATSSENGKIVGDVTEEVRQRDDLTMTPEKGGVGPLTVTSLFDNVITAARASIQKGVS